MGKFDPKTLDFVTRARAVHGSRYGYEATRYVNSRTAVTILCPKHKSFRQDPLRHLKGAGCKKCGGERRGAAQAKLAAMTFAEKARAVHGDRYGYDKVTYSKARAEVTITCAVHGDFSQEARVHLGGSGCTKCGSEAMAASRLSTASLSFIDRAQAVHGDRYGYEETVFKGSRTDIVIHCFVHGPFEQGPYAHLDGLGCRRCGTQESADRRRKSTNHFVADARKVHGLLYDYGLVNYKRRSGEVTILCPTHGAFPQVAGHHLRGRGCPTCGNIRQGDAKRRDRDEFAELARAVHGDRYRYAEVNYVDGVTQVSITCPVHGAFQQQPAIHLRGSGCRKCASERLAVLKRKDTATFIRDARLVHSDTYDYGLTIYRVNNENVTVECRIHGPFEIQPSNHLNGQGCWECGNERIRKARLKTQKRFLEDARRVHGDRYEYPKVTYEHSTKPVTITCRIHRDFPQTPSSHLSGSGCPRCNHFVSKPETEWLDSLGVPERSVPLGTSRRSIVVDGYDPETRIAYLFHGDYWHGNPKVFPPDGLHRIKGKTYGELYRTTLTEEQLLRDAGYTVVSIWESDFIHARKTRNGN